MFIQICDYFGTVIFAMTGAVVALNNKMSIMGIFSLAFVTAVGGGTIRDIFLGYFPVFWVKNTYYIVIIFLTTILSYFYIKKIKPESLIFLVADALGLAVFIIIGINKTLTVIEISPAIVVFMGLLTGAGGGILRDSLAGKIPILFQEANYALIALTCGIIYMGMLSLFDSQIIIYPTVIIYVIFLRLLTINKLGTNIILIRFKKMNKKLKIQNSFCLILSLLFVFASGYFLQKRFEASGKIKKYYEPVTFTHFLPFQQHLRINPDEVD